MAQKNLGRTAMLYRGEYDPERDYVALDIVYSAGSTYLCVDPCKGIQPPNADKWLLMAPSPALADRQAAEAAAQAAEQSKTAAAGSATAAEQSKTAAAGSATAAEQSKTAAAGSATAAEQSKTAAAGSAEAAEQAKIAAEQAAASVPTIDALYPVGIIIELTVSTSPATMFPGTTWARYGNGRSTIGVDENDTDFDAAGKTGGEKAHVQTIDELVSHVHESTARSGASALGAWGNIALPNNSGNYTTINSLATGNGQPFNVLHPYITVYRWTRTA